MYRIWQSWTTQSLACLLSMLAFAPAMVWAGPFGGHGGHGANQAQREARREMHEAARARREADREARGAERAELVQGAEHAGAQGRDGREGRRRLTPEERRALRQQINEAGQGIYPMPPKNN